MDAKPKRPPSVWIAQIILLLYGLLFTIGAFLTYLRENASPSGNNSPAYVLFTIGLYMGLPVVIFFTAFFGLAFRKSWARWLTTGVFSLMLIVAGISRFLFGIGGSDSDSRLLYVLGMLLIFGPFGFLVYRLAAGDAASAFFDAEKPQPQPQPQPSPIATPPPPPTFEG